MLARRFWEDESGQSVYEYGLLIALGAVILIAGIKLYATLVGGWLSSKIAAITSQ